jgi:broad specificity phosphatase PhoE
MSERIAIGQEARKLRDLLDNGLTVFREQSIQAAVAERDYRKAKAEAWARRAGQGLAAERQAQVDSDTSDDRFARDLAEALAKSARLAVQVRLSELDFLRSEFAALREDMRLGE